MPEDPIVAEVREARDEIAACAGTQFDPDVAMQFIDMCKNDEWHNLHDSHKESVTKVV